MVTETVGAKALELQGKTDEKINAIDLQKEIHKGHSSDDSFESQVWQVVDRGRNFYEGDFFVVVLFKKERLFHNVVRQYFLPRQSCPTPEYDQIVYKYYRKEDKIEFIWVVPDIQTVRHLDIYRRDLPDDQQWFLQFIRDFKSGELDKRCIQLNKEFIV